MKKFLFIFANALLMAAGVFCFVFAGGFYHTWTPMISMWCFIFMFLSPAMCWTDGLKYGDPFGDSVSTTALDIGFFIAGICFISSVAPLVILAHTNQLEIPVLYLSITGGFFISISMLIILIKQLRKKTMDD